MKGKGLNREILSLAGPSILANITIPLVGMVDIAVAGHMPFGEAATFIGGISIGSMLFDLLYWNLCTSSPIFLQYMIAAYKFNQNG